MEYDVTSVLTCGIAGFLTVLLCMEYDVTSVLISLFRKEYCEGSWYLTLNNINTGTSIHDIQSIKWCHYIGNSTLVNYEIYMASNCSFITRF